MEKVEKVIWGIIGAGDVCEIKSAPAMSQIEHSEVKMIMRRNAKKAADYANRHGIKLWTTDISELLNDPEINAIYIATPPNTHAELTQKVAKVGKAVYVEKPMANTYAECVSMIEVCQNANVPLFVAYYRPILPGFIKVKELIESAAIGDIRFVKIEMFQPLQTDIISNLENNWRVNPEIAGGGYFNDLASHQLDFLDFLFGPIVEANGNSGNQAHLYKADDIVTATFRFGNGILGSGIWCFTTDIVSEKETIHIVGSKGEITFNTFGNPMIIVVRNSQDELQEYKYSHAQPIQKPLIQLIVDELRGVGFSPSKGISGTRTNWVMDQIVGKSK
jgi:predicted dehydrogenase